MNKSNPDIYLYTAGKLGVKPEECVVFEDIIEGLKSSSSVGMKTVAVYDPSNEDYKDEITKLVIADFEMIQCNLGTIFDDHVLHNKLIYPTRDLCLASKISREDSMVTISCVYPKPNPDEILDFCILLSNDDQYVSSYQKPDLLLDPKADELEFHC